MNYGEYMSRYEDAVASAEEIENHIYYHLETCCKCGKKILPRETALTIDEQHYFHESHLGETTGKDLAIGNGADPEIMDDAMDMDLDFAD